MTLIDLATGFTAEELRAACALLGVREPLGLSEPHAPRTPGSHVLGGITVSDATAAALAALAAPESVTLIERAGPAGTRRVYVAVRGPWAGVHRVHGGHHCIESLDADDAAAEVIAAAALDGPPSSPTGITADVARTTLERMDELVEAGDVTRAESALEADGVGARDAASIVHAAAASYTHVLGLRSLGRRYEGCELAWYGGHERWLIPARQPDAANVLGPRSLRVLVEPVGTATLVDELAALFD